MSTEDRHSLKFPGESGAANPDLIEEVCREERKLACSQSRGEMAIEHC